MDRKRVTLELLYFFTSKIYCENIKTDGVRNMFPDVIVIFCVRTTPSERTSTHEPKWFLSKYKAGHNLKLVLYRYWYIDAQ